MRFNKKVDMVCWNNAEISTVKESTLMYVRKKKINNFQISRTPKNSTLKSQSTLKLKLALSILVLHSIKETSRETFVETLIASCIFTLDCIFKGFNKILNKCTSPQKASLQGGGVLHHDEGIEKERKPEMRLM